MFPEVKLRRQILDYQLPGKSNIISHYGIFTIKNLPRNSKNQPSNRIQTVDIETTEYPIGKALHKIFQKCVTLK